jgi:hypothetical protein
VIELKLKCEQIELAAALSALIDKERLADKIAPTSLFLSILIKIELSESSVDAKERFGISWFASSFSLVDAVLGDFVSQEVVVGENFLLPLLGDFSD